MTVQAKSVAAQKARPYHPWLHSFRLGLKQNAAVTAVFTFVFLLLYTAQPAFELIIGNTRPGALLPDYRYLYFAGFAPLLFPWLALVSALLQGVLSFRFLHGRRSSIAWLSLGLSRSDVFWSRFASGAAGALLPVVVSLTVTLGFNLALSPAIALVLARYAFFLIGMCLQILVLYSATVAVCARVATTAEAAVYSFALCLLPSVAIVGANAMMEKLLSGTPYLQPTFYPEGFNLTLLRTLSDWNPLLFFSPYMSVLGSEPVSIDARSAALMAMMRPNSANWPVPLGWAVVGAAIVWLARRLFMLRKAEIAGQMGVSRALGALCVLTVGFAAFGGIYALPFYLPKHLAFWAPLAAASGLALAAMLVFAFPFRLFARPRWKGLVTVFGGLAVMAALAGVFASGGLGYSDRVPDAADVGSVSVSYNGLDHYVQEFELVQGGFVPAEMSFAPRITLTDRDDIQIVTDIHRKLTGSGRLAAEARTAQSPFEYQLNVSIRYTMKNGAVVARAYRRLTADFVKSVITLDDTAGVKRAYADSLLRPREDPAAGDPFTAYMNGSIYLSSPLYSATKRLDLAADARAEFIQCLAGDLVAQPSSDRYLPDRPPVCVIEFVPLTQSAQPRHPGDNKTVYVSRQFTQTLAFLGSHLISVPEEKAVNRLCVTQEGHYGPIFTSAIEQEEYAESFGSFMPALWLTKGDDRLKTILSYCRSLYLASEGGHTVYIQFEGQEDFITAFLPAADAPDFVRKSLK